MNATLRARHIDTEIYVTGADVPRASEILTPEALAFVADLHRQFAPRIKGLLVRRAETQRDLDSGWRPDFLPETRHVRESDWKVAPIPGDLQDRRVEITGPVERKMIINALNSGAKVFMADFEDSNAPSWRNILEGQINLLDAVRRTISYDAPDATKRYTLNPEVATLMVRPRGLHLTERHLLVDGERAYAFLVDFGLYFFHNANELLLRGTAPYFYVPKLENHREARLVNDVFVFAQRALGIPNGTIRATVLIETLLAAFEMDEILYEMKEHSAGLNCGRWDYIFSFIKKLRSDSHSVFPDRDQVTMTQPCMRAYTQLLIKTCHRRGIHAMGGMAAQIPIKGDAEANDFALAKVRADKEREALDGHDGTWVAHPGLVGLATAAFDALMTGPNQIERTRDDVRVDAKDLLAVPQGSVTRAGVLHSIRVGVLYLEAWLRGSGCVPLYNLMEDAATAEICRMQLWQWLHHHVVLDTGRRLTHERLLQMVTEVMESVREEVGSERYFTGRFLAARDLFTRLVTTEPPAEFLTLPAYELLNGEPS